ncbi:chloride channel protein [Riemerella columbipharyngis]|uniref:H+/Cl-antiporter ClcA n=1 Tax=Riemerella columbipharyngis TaxID=1071918 RepID=A0A1G7AS02_9FLAO|nr:chloride channel protein [Riemerella columbipharyngis]SDE17583.1 H+/Cl-antiporter ClcA [Riemerella columbipharyngis]
MQTVILQKIRYKLKHSFDSIQNERLKNNLLQAIPFWVSAILTGFAAVMYAKAFAYAEDGLFWVLEGRKWMIFILAPIGFVLSWWLVKKYAPYSKGSGIPQIMAAVELSVPKERRKIKSLLGLRIIVVKVISSVILAFGGGAIGREGPTIQISSSIFKFINQILPKWWPKVSNKNMIMTGAAAGLSAAFNTPIGGIVFAIEELTKTHMSYFKTALFAGVIISGLTAQFLAGPYLYIDSPRIEGIGYAVVWPVLLISFFCGITSSYSSKLMLGINRFRKTKLKNDFQQVLFLVCIATFIASCYYFIYDCQILGSGKEIMTTSLNKHFYYEWYTPFFRMIGSALSFTSGGAGGVFAPALSAGASSGATLSQLMYLSPREANVVILAGMVAFLTGITRAPFTSTMLVLEMTHQDSLIFFLMLAGIFSSLVGHIVSKHSLYEELKIGYMEELEEQYEDRTLKRKVNLSDLVKSNQEISK